MALTDNLLAYWELEEASGTRVDAHASNDLTDHASVGSETAVVGNGATFNGSTQFLDLASGLLDGLTDFTIAYWAKTDGSANHGNVWGQGTSGGICFHEEARIFFLGSTANQDNTYANPFTTTLAFFVIRRTTTTVAMRKNDSTSVFSNSFSASGSIPASSGAGWRLGGVPSGSGSATSYLTGTLDQVGVWSRSLSAGEETALYNSGAGLSYTALGGGGLDWRRYGGVPYLGGQHEGGR